MVTAVRWAALVIIMAGCVPVALAGAGGASAAPRALTGPGAAAVGGAWGTAREVPGTARLNKGGTAQVTSVSCPSANNCTAGGFYEDGSGVQRAFVVSKVNGRWQAAIDVPGTAALNGDRDSEATSVSCASAGNCGVGGSYKDGSGYWHAFVASKVNGTWHAAIQVPGLATLDKGGEAGVNSVSCGAAGNCTAGGLYLDGAGRDQAFVVSEVNGTWHTAIEVPGTASLNQGGDARVVSASCASAGNCVAGGFYSDISDHWQAFVVSES